ncbi:MAG: hypothetical protein LBK61_04160 [Spirochaetaceae bacterium]|nr:hypothetical protein [Spirochaetaceae bacterium]
MNTRNTAAVCLFFLWGYALFAEGAAEKPQVYHDTWTLCVTEADVSELSPSRAAVGSVALQTIARNLAAVDRRMRLSEEERYYRNAVWHTAEREAAKKIADKQKQRDGLIFQGNKEWKYQQELKKIDGELADLREALLKIKADAPVIEREPLFKLSAENLANTFPAPPKVNGEHYFCRQKQVDGFLVSRISELHGRVVLEVKLYSLFARSYTYEDGVIFSTENLETALFDLSERIIENASQSPPAGLIVTAEPENAMIAVNERFEGRGESELIERNAGPVSVEVFADNHASYSDTIELAPEMLTELSVRLPPLPMAGVSIDTTEPAFLYQGALFIGAAPFSLFAPRDSWMSLMAETPDKKSASTVFIVNDNAILMKPVAPPKQDAVDKARRGFYGAWGRFWIALPLALVLNGMYSSYVNAYNSTAARTGDEYKTAQTFQYATTGAAVAAVGFGVEFAARLVYYVIVSNKERTPLTPKPEEEQVIMNNEELTINNEELTVNDEELAVDNEELITDSEELTINDEQ